MERLPVIYHDSHLLIRARDLLTPIERALSFDRHAQASRAAQQLDEAGFDFAPVIQDGRPIGYCAARELRGQVDAVADHLRSIDVSIVVTGDTPFSELLLALQEEPFLFALEGVNGHVEVPTGGHETSPPRT